MSSGKRQDNLDTVLEDIGQGQIKPVYFIYGSESYLVGYARKKIVQQLKTARNIKTEEHIDPDSVPPAELVHRLRSPSLFAPFQIFVVSDTRWFDNRRIAAAEPLREWLTGPPLGTTVVMTAESIDKRLGLVRLIRKSGVILGFDKVKSYDQGNISRDVYFPMIRDRLADRRQSIEPDAWQLLRQLTPDNLWAVINSVDVASAYAGKQHRISAADVAACIHDHSEMPGYMILDALGKRNPRELMVTLDKIFAGGVHGLMVNKTVSRRIRALLLTHALKLNTLRLPPSYTTFKNSVLPKIMPAIESHAAGGKLLGGMNPYALYLLLKQSGLFQVTELEMCLIRLEQVDLRLKSGSISSRELLESALLPLCRTGVRR